MTGSGIKVTYDPTYKAAEHGGEPQTLLVVDAASLRFPLLRRHRRRSSPHRRPDSAATRIPGLTVCDGRLPARHRRSSPSGRAAAGAPRRSARADPRVRRPARRRPELRRHASASAQVGLQRQHLHRLRRRPVPARACRSTARSPTARLRDDRHCRRPDTEAVRATLEFADGQRQGLQVQGRHAEDPPRLVPDADRVGLHARHRRATGDQDARRFGSAGAAGHGRLARRSAARRATSASTATARFVTPPGLRRLPRASAAPTATAFKWPTWLPIHIDAIGIQWPDIQTRPERLHPHAVGERHEHPGHGRGVEFSGSIDGHPDRRRQAARRRVPDRRHRRRSASRSRATLFGGKIDAGADRRHPQARRERPT